MARTVNAKPRLKEGVIKLEKPLSNTVNVSMAVNGAEIRRKKAEQLLKQRQEALKKQQTPPTPEQKQAAIDKAAERRRARQAAGCSGCRRKRGQE